MEMKLADNIRRFRKERALTQEQLAEVLGVTVGAVYKWEAKLSRPELGLIVEMADFFDTSVDVLLGYEMKDNRLDTCIERLKQYRRDKHWSVHVLLHVNLMQLPTTARQQCVSLKASKTQVPVMISERRLWKVLRMPSGKQKAENLLSFGGI